MQYFYKNIAIETVAKNKNTSIQKSKIRKKNSILVLFLINFTP